MADESGMEVPNEKVLFAVVYSRRGLRLFRRRGLSAEWQRAIAEKTEGHPLSLALTVDMLLSESVEQWDVWREVPAVLSAEFCGKRRLLACTVR